jgi:Spy/CpxP family protein refolding chaperone
MASAKGEEKMHPAMVSWWRARHGGCGDEAAVSCGPGGGAWGGRGGGWGGGGGGEGPSGGGDGEGFGAGAFGVRRPLRFLAYKLELDERQVAELARILDELKTERAQGEVDRRRTLSAFADAVGGETFDQARAKEAADLRVATAERLRDAVTKALSRIHALLDNDQRERLAYLIRTGALAL